MIGIACAITSEETYEQCAKPGILLAAEPDTPVIARMAVGSIFRSYNMLLDLARDQYPDLEALVILHQDSEILDPDFLKHIREAMKDPDVALVGGAGAIDVRSIAWWEGAVTWASFTHRFDDYGGGELPGLSFAPDALPDYAATGEVDMIDGFVIGFSPWAIENLRFDESIGGVLHGYDFDICMRAREAGKKVVTAPLQVAHHHSLNLLSEPEGWIAAHKKLTERWAHRIKSPSDDWEERARHAEAELSATRLTAGAGRLIWELRLGELEERIAELENHTAEVERSFSWRITAPIRKIAKMFRGERGPAEPKRVEAGTAEPVLPASAAPAHSPFAASSQSASRTSARENVGSPR